MIVGGYGKASYLCAFLACPAYDRQWLWKGELASHLRGARRMQIESGLPFLRIVRGSTAGSTVVDDAFALFVCTRYRVAIGPSMTVIGFVRRS